MFAELRSFRPKVFSSESVRLIVTSLFSKQITQLQFYLLVKLLRSEAMLVERQVELVSQAKLTRIQRKRYCDMHSKIIRLWNRFDDDEIDSYRLLKECSILAVPSV